MSAFDKFLDALRAHGDNVNETGQGKARGHCPAHNGQSDTSLAIDTRGDDKGIIIHCHAGCAYTDVLDVLGLFSCDLFDDQRMWDAYRDTATYVYPGGRQVHRKPGKSFPQSGIKTDRSLYRADRIGNATVVYVPEGEKDVLAIESIGGVAVCSAMGAGKAHLADWFPLNGLDVIIIADRDEPGYSHAEAIADLLEPIAKSVNIVTAAVGKDAADHIAAGKGLADFAPFAGFKDTDPIPLTGFVSFVSFPVGAFPTHIADMITAVAEATQTDPAMAGTSAISALSACAGGNAEIQIRDGWVEPLCTYSVAVADSGERKSAVQRPMLKPVLDAEAELVEAVISKHIDALVKKDIAEKALHVAIAKASKTIPFTPEWNQAENDALDARKAVDAVDIPGLARLVADDVTPEAAASLLHECGGSIAVVSAEGGVFDIIAGRYSGSIPNMDVWLKSHSGDMVRVDRKGRAPEYIRKNQR